jgi:DNA polymerase III sliding clamp (beta) subunit (PCNA family)
VDPALATKDTEPALTHYLFLGKKLVAHNGSIAISTPLTTRFKGAIPAADLRTAVTTVEFAERIKLEPNGSNVRFTAGKCTLDLPALPTARYPFNMPDEPQNATSMADEFFEAIKDCLQSVAEAKARCPEEQGITLINANGSAHLYATDAKTITHVKLPRWPDLPDRVILTAEFCRAMGTLKDRLPKDEESVLCLDQQGAMYMAGEDVLFGKVLASQRPLDFERIRAHHLPPDFPRGMVEISDRLKAAIRLAADIVEVKGDHVKSTIKCRRGTATFGVASNAGTLQDNIELRGHPDVDISVRATLLLRGYDRYQTIRLGTKSVVLAKPDSIYMVSAAQR